MVEEEPVWADGQRRRLTASGDSLFPENHSSQMLDRIKPGSSMNSRNVGLETVDVIDLDGFNLDEEDSWLLTYYCLLLTKLTLTPLP